MIIKTFGSQIHAALCLLLLSLLVTTAHAYDMVFPQGLTLQQGFANVRDFGAKGDGQTDDTQAFNDAMQAFDTTGYRMVYVPQGTYLISNTIYGKIKGGTWMSRVHLVGQNRDKTIIKLKDNAAGFGDANSPQPMYMTGSHHVKDKHGAGNTAFRNSVINLTLDLGAGNPGAVGVDYLVSNTGSIRDVTIRAPEGSGYCAIQMERNWPGPGLIKNVTLVGSDYGIRIASHQYSITVDNVTFHRQRVAGVHNTDNQIYMRRIRSENTVPFYVAQSQRSGLLLMDSELRGGNAAHDAIVLQNKGNIYLRNVTSDGYHAVVAGQGGRISEWFTGQPTHVFDSPKASLGLPVKEIPEAIFPTDASQWANVQDYGATSSPPASSDDTEALQKAFDSGKSFILIPRGKYQVNQQLVVRGNVQMIYAIGGASINMTGDNVNTPPLRIDDVEGDIIHIFNLYGSSGQWGEPWVVGNTRKTLVFRHGQPQYTNTSRATGEVFFEDVGGMLRMQHPQSVWAVQYNPEFSRPLVAMERGGSIWIFGMKIEMGVGRNANANVGHRNVINNRGGALEILGMYMMFLSENIPATWTDIGPFATNEDGQLSIALLRSFGAEYPVTVKERRGGDWRDAKFGTTSLYTGFTK